MKASFSLLVLSSIFANCLAIPVLPQAQGLSREVNGLPLTARNPVATCNATAPAVPDVTVTKRDGSALLASVIISTLNDALTTVNSADAQIDAILRNHGAGMTGTCNHYAIHAQLEDIAQTIYATCDALSIIIANPRTCATEFSVDDAHIISQVIFKIIRQVVAVTVGVTEDLGCYSVSPRICREISSAISWLLTIVDCFAPNIPLAVIRCIHASNLADQVEIAWDGSEYRLSLAIDNTVGI